MSPFILLFVLLCRVNNTAQPFTLECAADLVHSAFGHPYFIDSLIVILSAVSWQIVSVHSRFIQAYSSLTVTLASEREGCTCEQGAQE